MKALVFEAPEKPVIADVSMPDLSPNEVLVHTKAVGICHSDYELLAGRYIIPFTYPVTPGHEWSGEVVAVGAAVTGLAVGDRVVGECVLAETEHFGFTTDGAMSEFFTAKPAWLHKIPDSIDDTSAALIETFTVAYHALMRVGNINGSDIVAVLGAGPVGLMAVAAARAMGAVVVAIEPIESRREAAQRMGADHAVAPDAAQALLDTLTDSRGPSVVIEASGNPNVMAFALDIAGYGARVAMIGIDVGRRAEAALGQIQAKALTVTGTRGGPGVWPQAIRFLERAKIDLAPLVTERFDIADADQAIEAARDSTRNIKIHVESKAVHHA